MTRKSETDNPRRIQGPVRPGSPLYHLLKLIAQGIAQDLAGKTGRTKSELPKEKEK